MHELGVITIPTAVAIPKVQMTFDQNGVTTDEGIVNKVEKMVTELQWYAKAIKAQKAVGAPS